MNKLIVAAVLAAGTPAFAADVGVSVSVGQPGVYGRVDIGRYPQPVVIAPQPVVIERPRRMAGPAQPAYLWVPPGHRQNWRRYCGRYNACGVPVYFVQDRWYDEHVHHPERYRDRRDRDADRDRRDRHDRDTDRGHDRGRGPR